MSSMVDVRERVETVRCPSGGGLDVSVGLTIERSVSMASDTNRVEARLHIQSRDI